MPTAETTYLEAIRLGLRRLLQEHDDVLIYGEDVGGFGGAFKVTLGLQEEFGPARVFDTPIAESAILGSAIGMATQGLRPIVELQFVDFGMTAFHQLLNNAGTTHYRTGVPVPMTVRAPCGGGVRQTSDESRPGRGTDATAAVRGPRAGHTAPGPGCRR